MYGKYFSLVREIYQSTSANPWEPRQIAEQIIIGPTL